MRGRTEAEMAQVYEERRREAEREDPTLPPLRESFTRVIFRR